MYRIWSRNRTKKKSIIANSMIELVTKGKRKLDITGPVTVVMEDDGTEVDDDEVLIELKGTRLIFLTEGQQWIAAGSHDDAISVAEVTPSPAYITLPTADVTPPAASLPVTPPAVAPRACCLAEDVELPVEFSNDSAQIEELSITAPKCSMQLPEFSPAVLFHLENGTPQHVWVKMISEASDYYMHAEPGLYLTYQYQLVGKTMYRRYPSIGQNGPHPWSRFTSNLSRRMRHVRWKRKKSLSNMLKGRRLLPSPNVNPPISESVTYQVDSMLMYDDQAESEMRKHITKFETQE